MATGEFNVGVTLRWTSGNRDKLRPDGSLGSYADFTLPNLTQEHLYNISATSLSVRPCSRCFMTTK